MPMEANWTDRRIEGAVGNLLRGGVSLAALIVFLGAIIYLVRHGLSPVEYHVFRGEPADLRTVRHVSSARTRNHSAGTSGSDRDSGRASGAFDVWFCRGTGSHVCVLHGGRLPSFALQPLGIAELKTSR
jgi:hypothetical protein